MAQGVPYIPIRQYESENLERFLEMEAVREEGGSFNVSKHAENDEGKNWQDGDSYSENVDLILEGMGLGKYIENFRAHDIGLNILFHMTANDLSVIGVTSPKDQACFKKNLIEFNGGPNLQRNELYKIEEDLVMARNVCSHLEDINAHLNFIHFNLKKNDYEDYFVNPKHSILRVFDIVINRALTQARRMSAVLFDGSLNGDNLLGDCLRADDLELPEFMEIKLFRSEKEVKKETGNKVKKYGIICGKVAAFAICIYVSVHILRKLYKK